MRESNYPVSSGWGMLGLNILVYWADPAFFIWTIRQISQEEFSAAAGGWMIAFAVLTMALNVTLSAGFFVLQPNEARVLLLFGKYVGTARTEGFHWANPFFTKRRISLRLRNMNSERLKVNDLTGNPIEIALVLVWKVEDTFAACFEVDDYINYVTIQSESALRHLASSYPYDSWDDETAVSLRGSIDKVSEALEKELEQRLIKAGVRVLEARLSHLAYAPEIAEAMLRRQQAGAIISARSRIVEGAVGMVRMALEKLSAENVIELDDERKASMVSNLLVVLCGESNAQPVLNAGTLYH